MWRLEVTINRVQSEDGTNPPKGLQAKRWEAVGEGSTVLAAYEDARGHGLDRILDELKED